LIPSHTVIHVHTVKLNQKVHFMIVRADSPVNRPFRMPILMDGKRRHPLPTIRVPA